MRRAHEERRETAAAQAARQGRAPAAAARTAAEAMRVFQSRLGNAVAARIAGQLGRSPLQRRVGWTAGGKRNAGAGDTQGTAVMRIPVEGVAEGRPPGRALVLVPHVGDPPKTVDILFHLHGWHLFGFGAGYGQHGGIVDDETVYRIEQQLDALARSGRTFVAVLPQGPLGKTLEKGERENVSSFGQGASAVDLDAYVRQAFDLARDAWPTQPQPAPGRVVLSGHSGAGDPMKAMFRSSIAHDADPTKPSQLPARTRLEGVVSFDTINGPDQYDSHRAFLLHQLDLDLAGAVAAAAANGGAAGDAAARQQAWIDANGFRFRSVYSAGYAAWYDDPKDAKGAKAGLKQAFEDWIASHTLPAPVESALRRNYTFTPAGVEHMEMIGGVAGKGGRQHENLRDALRGMP